MDYNAYYYAQYYHKISPRPGDVEGPFLIPGNAFADRAVLTKAMRKTNIISSPERVATFRPEHGDHTVCILANSIWHAIRLTPADPDSPPAAGADYPGYHGKRRR